MTFLAAIVMCGSAVMIAWHYWKACLEDDGHSFRWFLGWVGKGLVLPSLFWGLINVGLFWSFGPFMPDVNMAQAAGEPWVGRMFRWTGLGILLIASYWLALSLGWLLAIVVPRVLAEHQKELRVYNLLWSALVLPIGVWMVAKEGLELTGLAAAFWFLPLVHTTIPLTIKEKVVTSYAAAIGKLKFGKVREAEQEILKQLEAADDDFDGWMLLAEVYATQFKDMNAADQTVRDLCAQPELNAGQVVTALHRLADWHLQIAENPAAARETLDVICKAYPGTHLAKMAQLRINQIPTSRKQLEEGRRVRTLRLPAIGDSVEESTAALDADRTEASRLANELVAKLAKNPDDIVVRERLAVVFAERLGQYQLGIEQLELLLGMAGTEEKTPQWLSQIASWQFKLGRDSDTGRNTLQLLIERFPQSAQAFAAQRRLMLLEMEAKLRRAES